MTPLSVSSLAAAGRPIVKAVTLSMIAVLALACASARTGSERQMEFNTPEEAVASMVEAAGSHDIDQLMAIFGPQGKALVSSGDEIQDESDRENFTESYREKHLLERDGTERVVLLAGNEDWPFPIPIVKEGDAWFFDTQAGIEEILDRRIGKNELKVIDTMIAYTAAQREYGAKDRNGDGVLEYAQRIASREGTRDGLYWETGAGQEESPFGPLVALAAQEGYLDMGQPDHPPTPYHGYFYKMLKGQGDHAPGGTYDYMVNGRMLFGFALLAYPSNYGSSGIMTFMVNQDGIVYQKDLGQNAEKELRGMNAYDPDPSWAPVVAE